MEVKVNDLQLSKNTPLEHKRLEAGVIGKLLGTGENAPVNIAGFTIGAFTLFLIITWGFDRSSFSTNAGVILPIISLALGYIFGKNS